MRQRPRKDGRAVPLSHGRRFPAGTSSVSGSLALGNQSDDPEGEASGAALDANPLSLLVPVGMVDLRRFVGQSPDRGKSG